MSPGRCVVWIDTTVYSASDDDRDDEWDDHACRVYAKNHGLIVARTLVTSKRWQQQPLTVLRDHLRAHGVGIVVVPPLRILIWTRRAPSPKSVPSVAGPSTPRSFPDLEAIPPTQETPVQKGLPADDLSTSA